MRKKNPNRKRPSCARKIRYKTKSEAAYVAGLMTGLSQKKEKFNEYWCHIHKCYHVGHTPIKEVRRYPKWTGGCHQEARL